MEELISHRRFVFSTPGLEFSTRRVENPTRRVVFPTPGLAVVASAKREKRGGGDGKPRVIRAATRCAAVDAKGRCGHWC